MRHGGRRHGGQGADRRRASGQGANRRRAKEQIAGELQALVDARATADWHVGPPWSYAFYAAATRASQELTHEGDRGGPSAPQAATEGSSQPPEPDLSIETLTREQIAGELQALQTATDEGGTSSNENLTKEQIAGGKHNNAGKGWTPALRAEYAAAIEVRQRQIAGEHQALQTATGEVAKSSMKKVTKEIAGELQALQTAAEEALQTTTEQAARPPNETLTKEPTAGGPHAALPSSKRPWFA